LDELEEIRRRKLLELQARLEELQKQQELQEEIELRKREILSRILEPEAKERLARIKLVKPELAEAIENQLISLARTGRINQRISDKMLVEILKKALPKKREGKIIRL